MTDKTYQQLGQGDYEDKWVAMAGPDDEIVALEFNFDGLVHRPERLLVSITYHSDKLRQGPS